MSDVEEYNRLNNIKFNPKGLSIDFNEINNVEILAKEISRCKLTGTFTKNHKIKHGNIVLSRLDKFISESGSFEYVDFKDSNLIDSSFLKTSFDYGALINSNISDSTFSNCHFKNVSFTGCKLDGVKFIECDLSNVVIESCKFYNCSFNNCPTSNKLSEFSIFENCMFEQTDLQIQTITDNFGLSKENLIKSKVRSNSIDEDFGFINNLESIITDEENQLTSFDKFKLEYYRDKSILLNGSEFLDNTFVLSKWLEICEIPSTFINILNLYYEFLLEEFDKNQCTYVPIIKLHTLTAQLTSKFEFDNSTYNSIMGVHMGLARIVEKYLNVIVYYINAASKPIRFVVEGPTSIDYYYDELDFIFLESNLKIEEIKKHNSPDEIIISWVKALDIIPIVALFFATRIKIKFQKYYNDIEANQKDLNLTESKKLTKSKLNANRGDKFSLIIGVDEDKEYLYGIKLKTIIPGSLLMDLQLQLSTRVLSKARTILIQLLKGSGIEKSS